MHGALSNSYLFLCFQYNGIIIKRKSVLLNLRVLEGVRQCLCQNFFVGNRQVAKQSRICYTTNRENYTRGNEIEDKLEQYGPSMTILLVVVLMQGLNHLMVWSRHLLFGQFCYLNVFALFLVGYYFKWLGFMANTIRLFQR